MTHWFALDESRPRAADSGPEVLVPLIALSWLAAAFLAAFGVIGANVGLLPWPAAAFHLVLAVLLHAPGRKACG